MGLMKAIRRITGEPITTADQLNINPALTAYLARTTWTFKVYQFDDFDQHPVVSGVGHQFEENRCQGETVFRILTSKLTDHIHGCRLDTCVGNTLVLGS